VSFLDLIGAGRPIEPAVIQAAAAEGSTRYPYAEWMPLPENETQSRIVPTQFIFHTMAGPNLTALESLRRYLERTDITGECTFILDLEGRMAQLVETTVRADNNASANSRAGSIETQDRGYLADPGIVVTPWTDIQLAQLAGLAAFYNLRHGVPLHRPVAWDQPGMGGHRDYPEWSIYTGKTCPGQARYEQIPLVLAAAQQIVEWRPPPPPAPPIELSEAEVQEILDAIAALQAQLDSHVHNSRARYIDLEAKLNRNNNNVLSQGTVEAGRYRQYVAWHAAVMGELTES
jgi:hypothetical protein